MKSFYCTRSVCSLPEFRVRNRSSKTKKSPTTIVLRQKSTNRVSEKASRRTSARTVYGKNSKRIRHECLSNTNLQNLMKNVLPKYLKPKSIVFSVTKCDIHQKFEFFFFIEHFLTSGFQNAKNAF